MNTGPGHSAAHGPSSLPNWWPADPRHHTSTSTSDVMSQLCRVCGEPAAGFHFGAFTCEGCKSFFGRTYNNLGSISECKNNGECVINKKNRTSCKACRLRKCLVVGMSKSGSRYGRRSNWFKIHCLLQEQQQHHHHQHQHQHQQQHQQQNPLHQAAGVAGPQHFQQQLQQQQQQQLLQHAGRPSSLQNPGRTPPPPPPPSSSSSSSPWTMDVKHHLRLDADNNNSVARDLNKQDIGGGRLSVSAAAAAAAVVQAVRPELLRWPSPFFPAFPFPPPAPFFLALQPPPLPTQPPPPPRGPRSSSSPASRSSTVVEDDDDRGGGGGNRVDDGGGDGRLAPKCTAAAVDRALPPVQESPMDLSMSAASAALPQPRRRRPPSWSSSGSSSASDDEAVTDGLRSPDGTNSTNHQRRRRRRRRRRKRRRRGEDHADGRTSASASDCTAGRSDLDADSDSCGGEQSLDERPPVKNVPLDLTFNRA